MLAALVDTGRQRVVVEVALEDVRAALEVHDRAEDVQRAWELLAAFEDASPTGRKPRRLDACRCPSHTASRVAAARGATQHCTVCALLAGKLPFTETEQLQAAFIASLDAVDRELLHRSCPWRGKPLRKAKLPAA